MRSTDRSTDKYPAFGKIPRLNRTAIITEKLDGTNALVEVREIDPNAPLLVQTIGFELVDAGHALYGVRAGSRNRWITPEDDNFGFAAWVRAHAAELTQLGPGLHYGEWYGKGIQRGYGLDEKRFALFNSDRWTDPTHRPACCDVVPVLERSAGHQLSDYVDDALVTLRYGGSKAVPGYMRPEGVVVYHTAAGQYFKVLLEGDAMPKGVRTEADCA